MPVGSEAEVCWRGTKDCFHIYLGPKLTARVAMTSFEMDVSHTAIPPLDALILPELRTTMLAVKAELTTGGLGGPLMIESLANILAVHLLRYIFRLRRHECANAAMGVYNLSHERSRELYDLTMLEVRRVVYDNLSPRQPIVAGRLLGTRCGDANPLAGDEPLLAG